MMGSIMKHKVKVCILDFQGANLATVVCCKAMDDAIMQQTDNKAAE